VPPGISDATLPNPVFSLSAAATVDEGKHTGSTWPTVLCPWSTVSAVGSPVLGNYSITATSAALNMANDHHGSQE